MMKPTQIYLKISSLTILRNKGYLCNDYIKLPYKPENIVQKNRKYYPCFIVVGFHNGFHD